MARLPAAFPFNLLQTRSGSGPAGRFEFVCRLILFALACLIWFPWKLLRGVGRRRRS